MKTMGRIAATMQIVIPCIAVLLASPAWADERLLGNWKLITFFTEDVQTKERNNTIGITNRARGEGAAADETNSVSTTATATF
jgi:hypothetical protein